MRKLLFLTVVLLAPFAVVAGDGADQQARTLFEADWQWRMQNQPEYATMLGDYRYDATLSDTTLAASRTAIAQHRKMLEQLRLLERDKLSAQNQLAYDIFAYEKEQLLRPSPIPWTWANGITPANVHIIGYTPRTAAALFIDRYINLGGIA